jgi:hypothetical protein
LPSVFHSRLAQSSCQDVLDDPVQPLGKQLESGERVLGPYREHGFRVHGDAQSLLHALGCTNCTLTVSGDRHGVRLRLTDETVHGMAHRLGMVASGPLLDQQQTTGQLLGACPRLSMPADAVAE